MKYTGNTITTPVVGKEAIKLAKAMRTGATVANAEAMATAQRIVQRRLAKANAK